MNEIYQAKKNSKQLMPYETIAMLLLWIIMFTKINMVSRTYQSGV